MHFKLFNFAPSLDVDEDTGDPEDDDVDAARVSSILCIVTSASLSTKSSEASVCESTCAISSSGH